MQIREKKGHYNLFHEFDHFCYLFCADAHQHTVATCADKEPWSLLHRPSPDLLQSARKIGIHCLDEEGVELDCSSYGKR